MKVIKFAPPADRVAAEAALVEKLKAETYAFSGTLTVAQVLGCFQIAAHEILDEQT